MKKNMDLENHREIIIPEMDNYRNGIPVLSCFESGLGKICNPKYDISVMGGRVLRPIMENVHYD